MKECFSCNSGTENLEKSDSQSDYINNNSKEDFICPACIGAGFAAMGIGATTVGSKMSKQKYKSTKNILFWSGIVSIIIAILLIIWGLLPKKYGGCNSCKVK
jgi:hypothetical protein